VTQAASETEHRSPNQPRHWPDYVIALVGSLVGAYVIGWLVVRWALEFQPGNLVLVIVGPIVLVPLGSAGGTSLALALFRRHSPVLTGILTLPVTIVVGILLVVLTRFINTMDHAWPIVIPPLVAPLGARFIVLGRQPPPSKPQPWIRPRHWPIRKVLKYGIPILLATLVAWFYLSLFSSGPSDVPEPALPEARPCECRLLTDWVEHLSILPGADFRVSGIRAIELSEGFVVLASQYVGDDVDPQDYWTLFGRAGFSGVQTIDEPPHWSATFFDGDARSESSWTVDVALIDSNVSIAIRVKADGSEWGITTKEQLWDLYTSNREGAIEVQMARQADALDILEPVERALQGG